MGLVRSFLLCVAGVTISLFPLQGSVFRSNSLGQALQEISVEESEDHQFILEVSQTSTGKVSVLYEKSLPVKRVEVLIHEKDGHRTVTETYLLPDGTESKKIITTFTQDLPHSLVTVEELVSSTIIFGYDNRRLVEKKELRNGILTRFTTFYRGSDGMLSGLRVIDADESTPQIAFFSLEEALDIYAEGKGDDFTQLLLLPSQIIYAQKWTDGVWYRSTEVFYDENNQLVVREFVDDRTIYHVYGPDGMLTKQEEYLADIKIRSVLYTYDEQGQLYYAEHTQFQEKVLRTERWYQQGTIQTITEWVDDVPMKATRFLSDNTSVVTLFENGRPYADVTYAPDGRRVLSLEYRKER